MKKIYVVAISAVLLLGALSFAGCTPKDNPYGYDANIVVQSSRGDEWLFAPETEELSAEYEYTGEEIVFRVARYTLPTMQASNKYWWDSVETNQDYRNVWFDSGNASEFYQNSYVFYEENGKKRECKHEQGAFSAKEKGEYVFGFKTSGEGVFRYREFYLKVTIG